MPEQKIHDSLPKSQGGDQWLENLVESARAVSSSPEEIGLINTLLDKIDTICDDEASNERRIYLAAAFDLIVAAEYYSRVAHIGWVYCPEGNHALFYPYTNVCPRCVLKGNFVYHRANKPPSGTIGTQTSRLLLVFLRELLLRGGKIVEVRKGVEPVDSVFIDRSTNPLTVMFAEIKAAPLVTLPLFVDSQPLTVETEKGSQRSSHRETDFSQLFGSQLSMMVPVYDRESQSWFSKTYALGIKKNAQDNGWAFRGLKDLSADPSFLEEYFHFWKAAFHYYGEQRRSAIYWLTNACGQPKPRPDDWPKRSKGGGFESISDSKTSAGMDRTDDLKKAIYQVLKLGAEGRPSSKFAYKVGIMSNIHAIRHFEKYLAPLKDIIWTRDETGKITRAKELPPETELFNLFDGIISLTETVARDRWVRDTFSF